MRDPPHCPVCSVKKSQPKNELYPEPDQGMPIDKTQMLLASGLSHHTMFGLTHFKYVFDLASFSKSDANFSWKAIAQQVFI